MEFIDTLLSFGYLGLFLSAFIAATLLPMGSEAVLLTLAYQGGEPLSLLAVATTGNVLGSCVNYAIGRWAHNRLVKSPADKSQQRLKQAEKVFNRFGWWSLLFAWLPIIGDPLTLVAGVLRTPISLFIMLVTLGKLARYAVVLSLV